MSATPDRTSLIAVLVLFLGSLPLGLGSAWLTPLFLVPLAALVWVLRARVVADCEQIKVCNGLGVRRISWDAVDRLDVPTRGPVRVRLLDGSAVRLTALPRRRVKELLTAASA